MKNLFRLMLICLLACAIALAACDDDDDDNNDAVDDDAVDDDSADDDVDDDTAADDDAVDDDINPFINPETMGPYLVGNASFFFEDTSRELSCGEGNRWLLTEVWYPAVDNADDWPENYTTDFFLGRDEEIEEALIEAGINPDEELYDVPTGSYRDAPLHPDAPSMPIVLFSHGFSSNRFQNYTMSAYLASHGYLVVSPDHICNAGVALTPDDVVLFSILNFPLTLGERKADMSFLIDVMTLNPPEMFAGRLDNERIGFWGHSFGGVTVSEQFKVETRVGALIQLASFGFPPVPETVTAPSMYMWGKQDKWMFMFENWHDTYIQQAPMPKYELEFFDTGHFAFSDLCEFSINLAENGNGCITETRIGSSKLFTNPDHDVLHEVLNAYATAFFGAALFDYPDLWAYLAENHWPEMMEYFPETL